MTRSEKTEGIRVTTSELVADITQEIRDKLKPLIPPQGSPVTIGASSHQVRAGLTNTLGGVRSREQHNRPTAMWRIPHVLSWTGSG